jgi:hypothetical protein
MAFAREKREMHAKKIPPETNHDLGGPPLFHSGDAPAMPKTKLKKQG